MPITAKLIRRLTAVATAFLLALSAPIPSVSAQPAETLASVTANPLELSQRVGPATVSLESSAAIVTPGAPLRLAMSAAGDDSVSSVQLRLKVSRPTGRIIFQRTRTAFELGDEPVVFAFERATDDLDLRPGAYPVELEARVVSDGEVNEAVLQTALLVYNPTAEKTPVALAARIFAPPLSDSQGRFVSDPAVFTRARDEMNAITDLILSEPNARLTVAIAPVLLEEWKRISLGYETVGPEGVTAVPATSPVARSYAVALTRLSQAIATDRLELMSLGYADPNLSDLAANRLADDTVAQYAAGVSACFAAIEATPSPGTAPAGGCVPNAAIDRLIASDIAYALVRPRCARSGEATVGPGVYRAGDKQLIAVVSDDVAARHVASGDASEVAAATFARHTSDEPGRPLPILVELGPGRATASASIVSAARAYLKQPWVRLVRARDVARQPEARVRLVSAPKDRKVPAGYWAEVAQARLNASGLTSATAAGDTNAVQAQRDSLLAESSAWAGPAGDWVLAERGRGFSAASLRTSRAIFDAIRLAIEPITLSGTRGDVPVTVTNGTSKTLKVELVAEPEASLALAGPESSALVLQPRENFFEIPVDLQNSISGRLTVRLMAGPVEIDKATVVVRASYLDRLAVIGGIVLALGAVLAFIIRRVRGAEAMEMASSARRGGYTEDTDSDEDGSDR